jgi:hypothetical protein
VNRLVVDHVRLDHLITGRHAEQRVQLHVAQDVSLVRAIRDDLRVHVTIGRQHEPGSGHCQRRIRRGVSRILETQIPPRGAEPAPLSRRTLACAPCTAEDAALVSAVWTATRETWPAGACARAGPPERAVSGTAAKTTATTDTATRPSTATSPPKASNRMELAYRYANTSAAPPARPTNRTWIRRQRQAVRTPGSSPRRRCAAGVPHRLCKRRGLTMNHRPGDRPTRSPPHANGAYHRMQERHPESANLRAAAKQPAPAISHT